MKPIDAKKNPGLAKLPTSIRNKMGYMKKGGLTQHPVKNGSKRMKKFAEGGTYFAPDSEKYTGDDEIVKYRMGQIKDPGVDLFKLARGEEQVAKPVEFEKNKYIPNKDSAMDNKDVGKSKADVKEESFESGFEETEGINSVIKPTSGGKAKVPVVKETTKTTITKVEPKKEVKNTTDDESSRRAQNRVDSMKAQNADINVRKRALELTDKGLEESHPEDYIPGIGALSGLLRKGLRNLGSKFSKDITPKPPQIGKDVERISVDRKQISYDPKKLGYTKKQLEMDKSGQANRASSSGALKDEFKPSELRSDFKKGGKVKSPTMSFQTYSKTGKKAGMKTIKMSSGGKVSSASSRGDGCAIRGKTRA
mgnify:CR=1 FL=1|tara:strand:- start:2103 stop:3197 length:1095 start_codon:yes stop_codon:yes gene_type:complete